MFKDTAVALRGDSITAGGNAGDEVPNTATQKHKVLERGYVAQFRRLVADALGVDAGKGWLGSRVTRDA